MSIERVLCFDVESNGLYVESFAVGAVVLDTNGKRIDQYIGRAPIEGDVDPWVAEHVLPSIWNVEAGHSTAKALRMHFGDWYKAQVLKQPTPLVVADCMYPVDAVFLAKVFQENPSLSEFAPRPLYDLSTLILAVGLDAWNLSREDYAKPLYGGVFGAKHNPLYDAFLSASCALRALRVLGRIN